MSTSSPRAKALTLIAMLLATATPTVTRVPDALAQERAQRRPNVLLIVTDDQRIGMLRDMPAVRRLFRKKGIEFTNAFATTPLCCPSRSTIMTGQYAHNHGVLNNYMARRLNHDHSLQRYLHDAGYRTGLIGKFLNAWDPARNPPHFDEWALAAKPNSANAPGPTDGYRRTWMNLDGRMKMLNRYSTDFFAKRSVGFIRRTDQRDARPWFLYVAPNAPHEPYLPAHRHASARLRPWRLSAARSEADRSDKAPWIRDFSHPLQVNLGQRRTLLAVDELVTRLFRAMNRMDEARDTIAIFMSDNGYQWGEHGLQGKRHPYTESVRIPLLIRWPGELQGGVRKGRLAANVDIAPTVYDALNMASDVNHTLDGRSLFERATRKDLLLEFTHELRIPSWASIRTRRRQYIEYYDGSGSVTYRELYHLRRDPGQLRNMLAYGNGGAIAEDMAKRLDAVRSCGGSRCP